MKKATSFNPAHPRFPATTYSWSLLVIFFLSGMSAMAQTKWNVSIAGGVDVPFNTNNTNLKTGLGFEFGAAYRLLPHLAIYTGWSWNKFPEDSHLDFEQEETGYMAGLQFRHPISTSRIEYQLKAGATYKHIETENSAGKIIGDTGHGWGWQAGGGVILPIAKRWSLVPEIRYNSLKRDIIPGNGSSTATLNYLSASLGISWAF